MTSILSSLDFAHNFYHAFFFLIIGLYFFIPAAIAQIFNSVAELVIPTGIPSKEANTEIQIHPVVEEAKIRKCAV